MTPIDGHTPMWRVISRSRCGDWHVAHHPSSFQDDLAGWGLLAEGRLYPPGRVPAPAPPRCRRRGRTRSAGDPGRVGGDIGAAANQCAAATQAAAGPPWSQRRRAEGMLGQQPVGRLHLHRGSVHPVQQHRLHRAAGQVTAVGRRHRPDLWRPRSNVRGALTPCAAPLPTAGRRSASATPRWWRRTGRRPPAQAGGRRRADLHHAPHAPGKTAPPPLGRWRIPATAPAPPRMCQPSPARSGYPAARTTPRIWSAEIMPLSLADEPLPRCPADPRRLSGREPRPPVNQVSRWRRASIIAASKPRAPTST